MYVRKTGRRGGKGNESKGSRSTITFGVAMAASGFERVDVRRVNPGSLAARAAGRVEIVKLTIAMYRHCGPPAEAKRAALMRHPPRFSLRYSRWPLSGRPAAFGWPSGPMRMDACVACGLAGRAIEVPHAVRSHHDTFADAAFGRHGRRMRTDPFAPQGGAFDETRKLPQRRPLPGGNTPVRRDLVGALSQGGDGRTGLRHRERHDRVFAHLQLEPVRTSSRSSQASGMLLIATNLSPWGSLPAMICASNRSPDGLNTIPTFV